MDEKVLDIIAKARAHFGVPYIPCNGNRQADLYSFFVGAAMCAMRHNLGLEVISVSHIRGKRIVKSFGYSLPKIVTMVGRKNHANAIHHSKYHEQNLKIECYKEFYSFFDTEFSKVRQKYWPAKESLPTGEPSKK